MVHSYKIAVLVASGVMLGATLPMRVFCSDVSPAQAVVVLAGDVLPGVDGTHWYDRLLHREGAGLFNGIAQVFASADVVVANLEGPLTMATQKLPKEYNFRGDPSFARVLAGAGIRVVTLGNNHAFDYGIPGFLDTCRALREAGILFTGAGRDRAEAYAPAIVEVNGIRLGFLGFSDVIAGPVADQGSPGLAWVRESGWTRHIVAAKERVDALFVTVHWGVERSSVATDRQRAIGRAAVRAGADVVFGHHSHCVQEIEEYQGRPIYYGLGELAFYRVRREQLVAEVTVCTDAAGTLRIRHRPIPIVIVDGRPILDPGRGTPAVRRIPDPVAGSGSGE